MNASMNVGLDEFSLKIYGMTMNDEWTDLSYQMNPFLHQ